MGQSLIITLHAPPVPSPSPLTPITATLSLQTDADTSPHAITLTEEPRGAVLGFDTAATTNFGSFGQMVLLQAASQSFNVTNTGNAPASVTVVTAGSGSASSPFAASTTNFTVAANGDPGRRGHVLADGRGHHHGHDCADGRRALSARPFPRPFRSPPLAWAGARPSFRRRSPSRRRAEASPRPRPDVHGDATRARPT